MNIMESLILSALELTYIMIRYRIYPELGAYTKYTLNQMRL